MLRKLTVFSSLVALLSVGCQGGISGSGVEPYEDGAGIVGSKPDPGHPSVVALTLYGYGAFCSGVLINSYTVLTSARCIVDIVDPYSIEVFFGSKVKRVWNGQGFSVPVWDYAIDKGYNPYTLENDIGLLFLWYDVEVEPSPLEFTITEEDLGRTISYVGFRPNLFLSGSGQKTIAEVTLEEFNEDALMYLWRGEQDELPSTIPPFDPEESCVLGAGSPTFLVRDGVEYVIGINSYSSDDCESFGVNRRPTSWVDPDPQP